MVGIRWNNFIQLDEIFFLFFARRINSVFSFQVFWGLVREPVFCQFSVH